MTGRLEGKATRVAQSGRQGGNAAGRQQFDDAAEVRTRPVALVVASTAPSRSMTRPTGPRRPLRSTISGGPADPSSRIW
jgi:hypothetical protein